MVAAGTPEAIAATETEPHGTIPLRHAVKFRCRTNGAQPNHKALVIRGATEHNLQQHRCFVSDRTDDRRHRSFGLRKVHARE